MTSKLCMRTGMVHDYKIDDGIIACKVEVPNGYKIPKSIEINGIQATNCKYNDGILTGKIANPSHKFLKGYVSKIGMPVFNIPKSV